MQLLRRAHPAMTAPVITVLFGAPRWDGETGRLTRAFLSAAPDNAELIVIDAFARMAAPCNGCGACAKIGRCRMDDLQDVYESIERADVLIFASPVYYLSMPAPLKAIFDRMQPYWSARFCLGRRASSLYRPKRGALLTVSGSNREDGGIVIEKQTKMLMSILNCTMETQLHVTGSDGADYMKRREAECRRARSAGEKFFSDD